MSTQRCCSERLEDGAQKAREPAQEEAEVVAGGGEHGIDPIAVAPFEIIAGFFTDNCIILGVAA